MKISQAQIRSLRKKTLGYKERCPKKRAAHRQQLATAEASGKTLVYLDETGFQDEVFRSYSYVPRGECLRDLIASQRTRTMTLIVARLALRIANADDFPAQRRSAEAVQALLDTDPGLEGYRVSLELRSEHQTS